MMTEWQYLQEQAARAERLARSTLDPVTIERLHAFAAECREKAELESARTAEAAPTRRIASQHRSTQPFLGCR